MTGLSYLNHLLLQMCVYVCVTVIGCFWSSIQRQSCVWLYGHRPWGRHFLCMSGSFSHDCCVVFDFLKLFLVCTPLSMICETTLNLPVADCQLLMVTVWLYSTQVFKLELTPQVTNRSNVSWAHEVTKVSRSPKCPLNVTQDQRKCQCLIEHILFPITVVTMTYLVSFSPYSQILVEYCKSCKDVWH